MKLKGKKLIKIAGAAVAACLSVLLISDVSKADNPIIQNIYTADPAPMVSGDTLYVYTSHDEDKLIGNFYTMDDWKCYSTKDMVNWTDHGTVLSYWDFSWAQKNSAWAAQCVERDGKYYLYVPLNDTSGATVIGVAVGDSPTGPFEDPLDKPLIKGGAGNIDPTVYVDEDGQAYMYWGNPDLKCVKLKDNMIETEGDIITWNFSGNNLSEEQIADMQKQFGVSNNPNRRPTLFEEAPWFYRRGDLYYMIYAANGIPERIDYSTSTSPLGPWTYQGMIMNDKYDGKGTGTFTNHPGIVDFKGHSYFFYHTGNLPGGGGNYHRSVAVEEFTYNEDGTIPEFPFTSEGVKAIDNLNPFQRVEAETLAWGSGLESELCSQGGINLCAIENEDYLKVKDVDFGLEGATDFTASVSSAIGDEQTQAGTIELHLDAKDGPLLGTLTVKGTGDWDTYAQYTTNVESVSGVHDLYMVFKGGEGELFKFDYWSFKEKVVPVETISLSASQLTILAGQSSQLTATVGPENATNKELTWTSSNEDVAIVAVDGRFTALKAGETTITAQAQDGTDIQASCHVVVTAPVVPPATVTPAPSGVPTPPTISVDKKTVVVLPKAKIKSLKKGKKNQAKLVIKKVKGATGYEVVYAKNKKFSKAKKLSTKKTSVTLKKLKKGTYYVKVRAYKTAVKGKKSYGSYSSPKKVKIK